MKTFPTLLACFSVLCASPAMAQVRVHVDAGDLEDAVESLGKQAEQNVLYPGDLLKGRSTAGVDGTLSPTEAFSRLLEGTSLTVMEEHGALRIAQAPPDSSRAPVPHLVDSAPAASAIWAKNDIQISCVRCDWTGEAREILSELGATGISATRRFAVFMSPTAAIGSAEAHWKTVLLDTARLTPRALTRHERAAWPRMLRTQIIPLFVTRNISESNGAISVDVLVADAMPETSECHRVADRDDDRLVCGPPDQWRALQASVGFSCKLAFGREVRDSRLARNARSHELCATAAEWRRRQLEWERQLARENFYSATMPTGWPDAIYPPPDHSTVPVAGWVPTPASPPDSSPTPTPAQ